MRLGKKLASEIRKLPSCVDCLANQKAFRESRFRKLALACAPESREFLSCDACLRIVARFIEKKVLKQQGKCT